MTQSSRRSHTIQQEQSSILPHLRKLLPFSFRRDVKPVLHGANPCDPLDVCLFSNFFSSVVVNPMVTLQCPATSTLHRIPGQSSTAKDGAVAHSSHSESVSSCSLHNYDLHLVSRDPHKHVLSQSHLTPLLYPSYPTYQTGGIFIQRHLLSVFLLRRVRRYVPSDFALSSRLHILLSSVTLQLALQNLGMIADRTKTLILVHLHRTPILNAHLRQGREHQKCIEVASSVSACRVTSRRCITI